MNKQTNGHIDTHHPVDRNRSLKDFLVLALNGFCMGIADLFPGVSGGTIAFMLGIYEDLIKAIRSFDTVFLSHLLRGRLKEAAGCVAWRFLGAVLFGAAGAILLFSRIVTWLLKNQPILINAFFFGLILATIPIIARSMKQWNLPKILTVVFVSFITFFFVQMVPINTPETWWFVFLSGALAICAMILPGISGAFILLLLGKYQFILNALHDREFGIIFIFISGIFVGILSFARLLGWLLGRYHDITIAVLTGFVVGSLNKIWPWKTVLDSTITERGKVIILREMNVLPTDFGIQFFLAILLTSIGLAVAFGLHAIPKKHLE